MLLSHIFFVFKIELGTCSSNAGLAERSYNHIYLDLH